MSDDDRASNSKTIAWVAVAIAGVIALVLMLGCVGAMFFARLAPVPSSVPSSAPVPTTPSAPASVPATR